MGQYVTVHDDVISHVNISDAVSADGGAYSCVASNTVGSSSHTARLNIYGRRRRSKGKDTIKPSMSEKFS